MGYEKGTIFAYEGELMLFNEMVVENFTEYLWLYNADGDKVKAPRRDCHFLLSPTEVDFNQLELEKE